MAIMAIFHGKGLNREGYEALRREVGWETQHAPGGIFHAASFDEAGGARVCDIWNSPEEMEAFVGTRLIPVMQRLGLEPPEVSVYPLHNLNAYPAIDDYKI